MTKSPFVLKLICIAGVLLCCHCKKEDKVRPPLKEEYKCISDTVVLMPQDLKDRFYFKEGTYWVYENTETHETDSMWVENTTFRFSPLAGVFLTKRCHEGFYMIIQTSKSKKAEQSYYRRVICNAGYPESAANLDKQLFFIQEMAPGVDPNTIHRVNCRGGAYETDKGVLSFPDSFQTNQGLIFRNILRFYYSFPVPDDLSEVYYCKNIGLIKFGRQSDNSQWELIRYHIEQ